MLVSYDFPEAGKVLNYSHCILLLKHYSLMPVTQAAVEAGWLEEMPGNTCTRSVLC